MGWMAIGVASYQLQVFSCEEECGWEERGDGCFGDGSVGGGEVDDGVWGAELVDGLAACSAGLAGGVVEVGDGDGADADVGAVEADGGGDGGLLGADGEAVRGVFDVAAGDDVAVGEEECGADAEVAVRGIGVMSDGDGALLKFCGLGG
jgi:hypothetical protein